MLKKCLACKNQISVNAKKCPKCGQQTSESQKAIVILIIVAFIIYAVSKQF